ncbi:hypothetical protein NQ318_013587 [Aromia moschata]|uniref:Cyclin-dependent kinase inhibitor domain-containing protein n=1 Tax=Aromia moschata TaxID=1265417 RepID=A0AAV8YFA7_9CUCU|nr:hypothetical protein NQ318_013587 [Aromia moschata]
MSTSVFYKPIGMTLSTRTHEAMLIYRPEIRKVKRVLFEPVDHVATQKFIEEELEKITVMESEKWNFDFKREKTLNPDGVYKWRPATPQKLARPALRETRLAEEAVEDLYGDPGRSPAPLPRTRRR